MSQSKMKIGYKKIVSVLVFFLLLGCESQQEPGNSDEIIEQQTNNAHTVHFFDELKEYCGSSFTGKTLYPIDSDHLLANATLKIEFETCDEKELRIPFYIKGESTRTWIISITDDGQLRLQHEHSSEDVITDELNLYGGVADERGTRFHQTFPADAETITMHPEALTNVWSIKIDTLSNSLIYDLKRNNEPRFKASFDLSKPIEM